MQVRFDAVDIIHALEERAADMAPRLMALATLHWPPPATAAIARTVVLRPSVQPKYAAATTAAAAAAAAATTAAAAAAATAAAAAAAAPPPFIRPPLTQMWVRKALVYALSALMAGQQLASDAAGAGANLVSTPYNSSS
jgi:hypothetical protein